MSIIKKFLEWIKLKEKLHINIHKPPLVSEGDLWWASIGENIGKEINGKSNLFSRPVLVFKKLSHNLFLAIPTTTKERRGNWFVSITHAGKKEFIILSQVRVLDTKRLSSRLGSVDKLDVEKTKRAFQELFLS